MPNLKNLKKYEKGVTLIELFIAIFILIVGVFAVLTIFPFGIKVMKSSEMSTKAVELAQEKIEETISQSYSDMALGTVNEPSLPSPFNSFRREKKVNYVDPLNGMVESATDKGIKKIEVTVYWPSIFKISQDNIKISTLVSQR